MTDPKQITSLMIVYGNEAVFHACKRLGIPQGRYQKLITSPEWQKAQKDAAVLKVKQIKERKTKNESV
jgi:hypothetical protein